MTKLDSATFSGMRTVNDPKCYAPMQAYYDFNILWFCYDSHVYDSHDPSTFLMSRKTDTKYLANNIFSALAESVQLWRTRRISLAVFFYIIVYFMKNALRTTVAFRAYGNCTMKQLPEQISTIPRR